MKIRPRVWLVLPPLVFLALFYFFPLAGIFSVSFFPAEGQSTARLLKLFQSGRYLGVLFFTTWQAALSTLATLILALPCAYVFARFDFKGKRILQSITTVPFVLPTVVTAAGFQALLGPRGIFNTMAAQLFGTHAPLINIDHTIWFVLLAHVFYNYTIVLRIVSAFWSQIPRNVIEAGRMLGASGIRIFFSITLPLLLPAITAASLLTFMFCFTSFGVVLILGGPRLATVEVEIYRQALHLFNLPLAAALSLVQIVFTFGLMFGYTRLERRCSVSLIGDGGRVVSAAARGWKAKFFVRGNVALMLLLLGAPLAALLVRSISTENGLSLVYFAALLENKAQSILYVPPVNAVLNSLTYAFAATVIALLLGICSAAYLKTPEGKTAGLLDPLLMLPLATSAVTLGFGFIVALDAPPLDIRTSPILPAIAHALVAFPFVIRSLLPAWRSIPPRLREAAAVLGASPPIVWRTVDWPVIRRAMAVGAVFAFAVSMGEFGASVFVVRPDTPTMPLAIFRFLSHPGPLNYGRAMAMSTLLMLITAIGFMLIEWRTARAGGTTHAAA